jgi:hypothetical protein
MALAEGRSQHLSEKRKGGDRRTGGQKIGKPDDAVYSKRPGPSLSPKQRQMNASSIENEDRVIRARQRISDGFYDKDEVRRAIAEALVFVLSARRN